MNSNCNWCRGNIEAFRERYWEGTRICQTCYQDAFYEEVATRAVDAYEVEQALFLANY